MFDSPPVSPFSILFLSTVLTKSCGEENRGWGDPAGPDGGRCFRTRELACAGRAQVQHTGSEALPPACFWVVTHETWPGCDGFAPWASTACQHTYSTHTHKNKKYKNIKIAHCLPQPQWLNFLCFLVFYMHIYMNMNILCECVQMFF